ncbi:hypothetical protein ACFXHK_47395 [Embleya sp. NPDC059267]|uniref:hypothetical protein n=1 Tax=Embleya sp. NPDC059267 TaxID=3346798 RepID=UPI0036BF632F
MTGAASGMSEYVAYITTTRAGSTTTAPTPRRPSPHVIPVLRVRFDADRSPFRDGAHRVTVGPPAAGADADRKAAETLLRDRSGGGEPMSGDAVEREHREYRHVRNLTEDDIEATVSDGPARRG